MKKHLKLIALIYILIFVEMAYSAPAFVQAGHTNLTHFSANPLTATFPGNVTAGNLIVVWVTWTMSTGKPTSVVDAEGNSYTEIPNTNAIDVPMNQQINMYYKENISCTGGCGTNTVTVNTIGGSTWGALTIAEFSGVATSGALDKSNSQVLGSSTTPASPSVTPATNGQLILGAVFGDNNASATITLSDTLVHNSGVTDGCAMQYKVQGTAAAVTSNFTFSPADNSIVAIVTFKAPSAATPIRHRVINY